VKDGGHASSVTCSGQAVELALCLNGECQAESPEGYVQGRKLEPSVVPEMDERVIQSGVTVHRDVLRCLEPYKALSATLSTLRGDLGLPGCPPRVMIADENARAPRFIALPGFVVQARKSQTVLFLTLLRSSPTSEISVSTASSYCLSARFLVTSAWAMARATCSRRRMPTPAVKRRRSRNS
jgi:hypothetical protein